LEDAAADRGISREDWQKFLAYVGGFYGNMGNYYAFGNNKFIPDLQPEIFLNILLSNPLY